MVKKTFNENRYSILKFYNSFNLSTPIFEVVGNNNFLSHATGPISHFVGGLVGWLFSSSDMMVIGTNITLKKRVGARLRRFVKNNMQIWPNFLNRDTQYTQSSYWCEMVAGWGAEKNWHTDAGPVTDPWGPRNRLSAGCMKVTSKYSDYPKIFFWTP